MTLRGVNSTNLSEKTGISKGLISRYVNGKLLPRQTNLYLISSYLDCSPAYLMGLQDEVTPMPTIKSNDESSIVKLRNQAVGMISAMSERDLRKIIKFMEEFL